MRIIASSPKRGWDRRVLCDLLYGVGTSSGSTGTRTPMSAPERPRPTTSDTASPWRKGLCDAGGLEDNGDTVSEVWATNGNMGNCTLSPYIIPAVQFNAVNSPAAIITSVNNASVVAGRPFSFTVTTSGIPTPRITEAGRLPHGLTFTNNGNGTATIAGKALTSYHDKAYVFKLRAVNLPTGGRNRQTFTLTLTGGRA